MTKFNRFIQQITTVLLSLMSIWVVWFVVGKEQNLFRHTLFVRKSLVAVYEVVSQQMVRKLVLVMILWMLGICGVVLYYLVLGNNRFLYLARCYFLAAGIISTLWELETLFYISEADSIKWNHCADICCVFFVAENFFLVTQKLMMESSRKKLDWYILAVSVLASVLVTINTPVAALSILKFYGWAMLILFPILCISLIRQRGSLCCLHNIWQMLFAIYLIFLVGYNKINPSSAYHKHYQTVFPYCLVGFCLILFCNEFWEYRRNVFYDKNVNQKIQQANEFKEEILNRIVNYCSDSLYVISGLSNFMLSGEAGEIPEEQRRILGDIKKENEKMEDFMGNLRRYNMMLGHSFQLGKMKIGFHLILNSALEALKGESDQWKDIIHCQFSSEEKMIYGDPYQVMRIHMDFLKLVEDLKCDGVIEIKTFCKDNCMETVLEISVNEEDYGKIRHVSRFLNSHNLSLYVSREEDTPAVISKNMLLLHQGMAKTFLKKNKFLLSYSIPLWDSTREYQEIAENFSESFEKEEKHREKIVLISSSPEQIRLIRVYVSYGSYDLKVFQEGKEALEYLRTSVGVDLVIVGSLFVSMGVKQVCEEIRREFTMVQLPIILIQGREYEKMENSLWQYVNDVMREPYGREKFLGKIRGAILLKQSGEDTLKARLDFWQSQMNPHFIFNSISTIMPLCLENPEQAYRLLGNFSEYLRGNLFGGELSKNTTIFREISLVEAYLELEKARFGDKIQYEIHVQCQDEKPILPLLIEPIVENSVKHGKKLDIPIHVWIDLYESGGWLYIQVKDNGIGIPEERLREIQQMSDCRSIGLSNIRKRLAVYYHEDLNIDSTPEEGTVVSFKIPIEKEEENESNFIG